VKEAGLIDRLRRQAYDRRMSQSAYVGIMSPMTAEQRAEIEARLDEMLAEVRGLSRRLDSVAAVLTTAAAA
jgi:hypothetical protein